MAIQHDLSGLPQLFLRMALGIGFILPVMDRVGLLGTFGSKNVAWGDWNHFVNYANSLMPYLNRPVANVVSVMVTIVEATFGVCLILGIQIQIMALAAAGLTCMFGLSMALFVSLGAPFAYPVFVFTGAALVLSGIPRYNWSFDDLLFNRSRH